MICLLWLFGSWVFIIFVLFNFNFLNLRFFNVNKLRFCECVNIFFLVYIWKYLGLSCLLNFGINLFEKLKVNFFLFLWISVISMLVLECKFWLNLLLI